MGGVILWGCLGRPFQGGIWGSYGALRGGVCRGHVGASTGLIENMYIGSIYRRRRWKL